MQNLETTWKKTTKNALSRVSLSWKHNHITFFREKEQDAENNCHFIPQRLRYSILRHHSRKRMRTYNFPCNKVSRSVEFHTISNCAIVMKWYLLACVKYNYRQSLKLPWKEEAGTCKNVIYEVHDLCRTVLSHLFRAIKMKLQPSSTDRPDRQHNVFVVIPLSPWLIWIRYFFELTHLL